MLTEMNLVALMRIGRKRKFTPPKQQSTPDFRPAAD